MNEEPRRKKRSDKLSDSLVSRLARDLGSSERLGAESVDTRPTRSRAPTEGAGLAKMGAQQAHGFTRCPHCREYVPIRDRCRACETPMN
jgi:hypothetical protein